MNDPLGGQAEAPTTPPPRRRGGGLAWWILSGVLVFVVISALTIAALLQSPPPGVSGPRPVTAEPGRMTSPGPSHAQVALRPQDSALTKVRLNATNCPNVKIRRDQVRGSELETYLNSLIDCLVAVHQEPFRTGGMTLTRPALSPESEVENSGCVTSQEEPDDWAGLYCSANTTIYYRTDWAPDDPLHYVEVITHEFAHHLQQEADILAQVSRDQRAARSQPNGEAQVQELSRRLELQAECLAGTMVGPQGPLAVRESEFTRFLDSRVAVPTQWAATHGTGRAQTRWFKAGAEMTGPERLGVCNTFAAPASLVE